MNLFLCGLIGTVGSFIVAMKMPLFFMVGSWATFFSGVSAISPLAGYFGGGMGSTLYVVFKLVWRLLFCSAPFGMALLVNVVPGWCATAFWIMPPVVGSVLVPLSAMFLFIMHPVGAQAYVYALLWLIPLVIYCLRFFNISYTNTFFAQALCATFVAHAVGSVLWLYGMPVMHAQSWIALAPIALAERLFFAVSMTAARLVVIQSVAWIKQLAYARNTHVQVVR